MSDYINGVLQAGEVAKVDNQATEGLEGTEGSLSYRCEEIEKHLHNNEKWFGAAAVAVGETHVADRMGPSIAPFTLTSGADDFGAWVQVMGSEDTPVKTGMVKYDAHRFLVTGTNSTEPYLIQVVCCESADIAAALVAEDYSEYAYISGSNNNDSGISEVIDKRADVGTKLWARCICIGQTAKTIDVYYGIHEYIG